MTPRKSRLGVAARPRWAMRVLVCALGVLLVLGAAAPIADAQRRKRNKNKPKKKLAPVSTVKESKAKEGGKNQVFDFTGLALGASMRTPQLLYFLERANEELDRASLQRRSFIPEMVRSISEEGL